MGVPGPDDPGARIDELSGLASLADDALRAVARDAGDCGARWIAEFVAAEMRAGVPVPRPAAPDEFVAAVRELARNKRAWSNRLAVLTADLLEDEDGSTAADAVQRRAAAGRLADFIASCPWHFLVRAARSYRD
jgi:hypothetical protein